MTSRRTTTSRYEIVLRLHIVPRFGKVPLSSMHRTTIREWIAELVASDMAPATAHKTAQVLSKALRAAQEDRLITHNPAERLPLPRIEQVEMRFLDHAEVSTLRPRSILGTEPSCSWLPMAVCGSAR